MQRGGKESAKTDAYAPLQRVKSSIEPGSRRGRLPSSRAIRILTLVAGSRLLDRCCGDVLVVEPLHSQVAVDQSRDREVDGVDGVVVPHVDLTRDEAVLLLGNIDGVVRDAEAGDVDARDPTGFGLRDIDGLLVERKLDELGLLDRRDASGEGGGQNIGDGKTVGHKISFGGGALRSESRIIS